MQVAVASRFVSGFSSISVICTFCERLRCGRSGSEDVGRAVSFELLPLRGG